MSSYQDQICCPRSMGHFLRQPHGQHTFLTRGMITIWSGDVWCKVIVWASYQPSKGNRLARKMPNKNSCLWILAVSFLVPHIEPLLCPLSRKETRLKADHGFLKKKTFNLLVNLPSEEIQGAFSHQGFFKVTEVYRNVPGMLHCSLSKGPFGCLLHEIWGYVSD